MDIAHTLALASGAAWASGIDLYATVFMLGYLNATGNITLPAELQVLSNPVVMAAAAIMYGIEFFADKVPGVDTLWDSLHTFIRIPAGAMLSAGAVGDPGSPEQLAAFILGGTLAAGSHATKAGSRVLINTSPEPFSNWAASIGEDVAVIAGLWTALHHPWVFLGALLLFILLMIWLLPKLWRGIKRVLSTVGRWLGAGRKRTESGNRPPDSH